MKPVFFFLATLLSIASPACAQEKAKEARDAKEPPTKLEAFLLKKGRLLVKDFHALGTVGGRFGSKMKFDALVLYEPGRESERVRGLRIEVTQGGRLERENTSFLDMDEIESLSKATNYMIDLSSKWKGANREYAEVAFSTKGDFSVGFYQDGSEQAAFASSGYIGKASCYLSSMEDLGSVRDVADKGLAWLSAK